MLRMGQWELARHGYNLEIDGSCGNGTDKFIKRFSKEK